MYCFRKTLLGILLLPTLQTLAQNTTNDVRSEIAALEKEKSALYSQISDAIDDSIKNFEGNNDTDVQLGLQYMLDLKKQLEKPIHASDGNSSANGNSSTIDEETRRARINLFHMDDMRKAKGIENDPNFIDKLFRDRNRNKKKKKLYQNREAMEARIAEWMKAKAEEKAKIEKYKNAYLQYSKKKEKCPNFGNSKKSGKGKKKRRRGYPCCRKCCKSSVLGCY